jgi:hypothetical protein
MGFRYALIFACREAARCLPRDRWQYCRTAAIMPRLPLQTPSRPHSLEIVARLVRRWQARVPSASSRRAPPRRMLPRAHAHVLCTRRQSVQYCVGERERTCVERSRGRIAAVRQYCQRSAEDTFALDRREKMGPREPTIQAPQTQSHADPITTSPPRALPPIPRSYARPESPYLPPPTLPARCTDKTCRSATTATPRRTTTDQ